jgi:hypothetical protein
MLVAADCPLLDVTAIDETVDWLCLPRFDSPACFAGLLRDAEDGRWRLAPAGGLSTPVALHAADGTVRAVAVGASTSSDGN